MKARLIIFLLIYLFRSSERLVTIIRRYIKPGSDIYSDVWAAYAIIEDLGYLYYNVIHKDSFKAEYLSDEGEKKEVHTNTIEGAWMLAKQRLRNMCGRDI